jgi:predicted Zn-dependent protease
MAGSEPGSAVTVAETMITISPMSNAVLSAATTIYFGAVRPNGALAWNRNGTAAYYTFLEKAMLHEIGHTMGLQDATDPPGDTVMNAPSGTNDSGGNIAQSVQTCDNGVVKAEELYS